MVESLEAEVETLGLMKDGSLQRVGQTARFYFAPREVCGVVTIRSSANLIVDSELLATVVAITPTLNTIACASAMLIAALACLGFIRLRATTLAAPCLWATIAASCLVAGALLDARFEGIGLSAFRFAIAATTLCPLMAVLGAKRPQNRGWQWVVLTLWIVLLWPAVQAVLLPSGRHLELFVAWKLFLWGQISIGLLNYLPTRHWLAAVLVAAGQAALLREHLWLDGILTQEGAWPLGTGCLLAAALMLFWNNTHNRDSKSRRGKMNFPNALQQFEDRWQNFRNAYGAFWALRILGRVNQTAELRDWPLRLHWSGFETLEDQHPTEEQLAELDQTLSTLLRRFVAMDK